MHGTGIKIKNTKVPLFNLLKLGLIKPTQFTVIKWCLSLTFLLRSWRMTLHILG